MVTRTIKALLTFSVWFGDGLLMAGEDAFHEAVSAFKVNEISAPMLTPVVWWNRWRMDTGTDSVNLDVVEKEGECESCGVTRTLTKIPLLDGHPDMDSWMCTFCIQDEFYHEEG